MKIQKKTKIPMRITTISIRDSLNYRNPSKIALIIGKISTLTKIKLKIISISYSLNIKNYAIIQLLIHTSYHHIIFRPIRKSLTVLMRPYVKPKNKLFLKRNLHSKASSKLQQLSLKLKNRRKRSRRILQRFRVMIFLSRI